MVLQFIVLFRYRDSSFIHELQGHELKYVKLPVQLYIVTGSVTEICETTCSIIIWVTGHWLLKYVKIPVQLSYELQAIGYWNMWKYLFIYILELQDQLVIYWKIPVHLSSELQGQLLKYVKLPVHFSRVSYKVNLLFMTI